MAQCSKSNNCKVTARHREDAMGKVDEAHQAHRYRKANGDQIKDHRGGKPMKDHAVNIKEREHRGMPKFELVRCDLTYIVVASCGQTAFLNFPQPSRIDDVIKITGA